MAFARRGGLIQAAKRKTGTVTFLETFTGTNGAAPSSANWTNPRTTTGATATIQNNTLSLTTGTVGNYSGFAGYMTTASYLDPGIRGDLLVLGTTELYAMVGFRSSATWSTTHGSALDSYWLEFAKDASPGIKLFRRVGNTPTTLVTASYTFTPGDTIHFYINVSGTSLQVRVWKNAEAEPSTFQLTTTAVQSTGRVWLSANGGADTVADDARFDNIQISGASAPNVDPPPTPTASTVRTGMTWTGYPPIPSTGTNAASLAHLTVQAQHIIGFGAENGIELNPSPGVYNWGAFDPAFNRMMAGNPAKPIIILCRAPGWMKSSGVTQDDFAILPAFRQQYANLCAAVVARYTNVQYFSFWNEMKGYYDNAANHYDWARYTLDYNAVWAACKAVRPAIKLGGPYVILESWDSNTGSGLSWPGGWMDPRTLQTVQYFAANATGYDFLSCDGGIENQFGAQFGAGSDPHKQLEKLWGFWKWVRQNVSSTTELINFETYVNQSSIAPFNYTEAQRQDLWIELCQKTKDNVPTPTVSYLSWGSPGFRPQVINQVDAFTWANTDSGFGAKVTTFEADPTPPPPTGGTIWNVPAQGTLQAVANQAVAGDTIYVSGVNVYPGAILDITNRNNGTGVITIIGNTGNVLRGGNGLGGFGSVRGWTFQNLNVEVNGGGNAPFGSNPYYFGEGFSIEGNRTDNGWAGGANGDGGGAGNIRIIGCTFRPIAGTGTIQRNGVAVWGADAVEIGNCTISDCSYNDNLGDPNGCGSGISCGNSRTQPQFANWANGTRFWIHHNNIRNQIGPGTPGSDRNGIILDLFNVNANHSVGPVIIEYNDIANCEGRGIQLLLAGLPTSPVTVNNNLVRAPIATNLGGSAPDAGIGGYGDGQYSSITVSNNDVTVSAGHQAYYFISFDGGDGSGVTGTGNIGTPKVFYNSPTSTVPPGF